VTILASSSCYIVLSVINKYRRYVLSVINKCRRYVLTWRNRGEGGGIVPVIVVEPQGGTNSIPNSERYAGYSNINLCPTQVILGNTKKIGNRVHSRKQQLICSTGIGSTENGITLHSYILSTFGRQILGVGSEGT
jgi:hypothetical protein